MTINEMRQNLMNKEMIWLSQQDERELGTWMYRTLKHGSLGYLQIPDEKIKVRYENAKAEFIEEYLAENSHDMDSMEEIAQLKSEAEKEFATSPLG
jgi:hypothetical protein|tara:strand:+ start:2458 stop:2745 length:288 start_codon:yes stop_codon:yes gene_type:complete